MARFQYHRCHGDWKLSKHFSKRTRPPSNGTPNVRTHHIPEIVSFPNTRKPKPLQHPTPQSPQKIWCVPAVYSRVDRPPTWWTCRSRTCPKCIQMWVESASILRKSLPYAGTKKLSFLKRKGIGSYWGIIVYIYIYKATEREYPGGIGGRAEIPIILRVTHGISWASNSCRLKACDVTATWLGADSMDKRDCLGRSNPRGSCNSSTWWAYNDYSP